MRKNTDKQKVRPGRPADERITKMSTALKVTRQRAGQILREFEAGNPDHVARLAAARLESMEQRGRLNRALAEEQEFENAQVRGDFISRVEQVEQGRASGRVINAALAEWDKDWPARLVGRSELEVGAIVREQIDALIGDLRYRFEQLNGAGAPNGQSVDAAPPEDRFATLIKSLRGKTHAAIESSCDYLQGCLEQNAAKFSGTRWVTRQMLEHEFRHVLSDIEEAK